jgi:hypothetical protein
MSITLFISLLFILTSLIGIAGTFALSNLQIYDWVIITNIIIVVILIISLLILNLIIPRNEKRLTLYNICDILIFIGISNFIACFIISIIIHGDAFTGKIVEGRYFVNSHGVYTEVGILVYVYSMYHIVSLYFTHPIAMFALIVNLFSGRKFNWFRSNLDIF